jgi:2-polyprenyl-3-methyl-5-hydroxy-6-metoxy-1,4-benzoquinol methylase
MGVWPPEEIEYLGHCPLCNSNQRRVLHSHLTDQLFRCAPGEWTLNSCQSCGTGYLDPRPNPQSIGKAYSQYFTHGDAISSHVQVKQNMAPSASLSGRIRQWVRAGLNSYRNTHWHMALTPTNAWGRWWVPCLWPLRSLVHQQMRHLPRRLPREGARLLDVGCGNGNFLALAQAAGWVVEGVDFDPLAVAAARKQGLNVHIGGLEQVAQEAGGYDWISCSHVIEHVHDPVQWLRDMYALLRPGGTLWLQTPNIESWGHSHFGPYWRGLEPPRHLVIFSLNGLCDKLKALGFTIKTHSLPPLSTLSIHAASSALRSGTDATATVSPAKLLRMKYKLPALLQGHQLRRGEFITVLATRAP